MKRAQALKYINDRLLSGASKAEVFEEIRGDVPFRNDLLSYLAEVPSVSIREKYHKVNIILFVLLFIIAAFKFITGGVLILNSKAEFIPWFIFKGFGLFVFAPFVLVYFTVMVFKFRGSAYRQFANLGIAYLLLSWNSSQDFSYWLIWHVPTVIVISLAYYIGKNAFPYYGFWGNLKQEIIGQELEQPELKKST
jgi:hypothetical protein